MEKKYMVCYETDASRLLGKAEKVVFPENIKEIQKIIKNSNLDIIPRGAGTGLSGGVVPDNSLIIEMEKIDKVINFDRIHNSVYVESGISIKELNEKLEKIGFEFPIQPLNKSATIGGMAAVNVLDSRAMRYGKMKDWIEELEFVNGKGELIKISKNDLGDVCGMEGITGVIVRLKLKITPKIQRTISIFQTDSLDKVVSIARRLKQEKDVVMLELFSKFVSKLLGLPEKYNLIIEFNSNRGKINGEEYKNILKLKEKAYSVLVNEGYCILEDYKFFFDKLKDFMLYLNVNGIPYFSYLGSGVADVFFNERDERKRKLMTDLIKKIGGKPGGFGIGVKRKDFVDEFERKIIQRIKLRHDPSGKLNKRKVIDFMDVKMSYKKKGDKLFVKEDSSYNISEAKKEIKTPEEKMNELIEEIEVVDEKTGLSKEEELLKDYEDTYKSELPEKRRERIEQFAKDVPRQIEKKGRLSKEEEDMVKRVMMGGFGLSNEKEEKQNDN